MSIRPSTCLIVLNTVFLGSVLAEARPIELGFDAAYESVEEGDGGEMRVIAFPSGGLLSFQPGIRVGVFVGPRVSIEPSFSVASFNFTGNPVYTETSGMLSVLYHLTANQHATRVYLRGGVGGKLLAEGDNTTSYMMVGGAVGVKIPAGDRLAVRMEGGLTESLENVGDGIPALTILSARIGLSFIN